METTYAPSGDENAHLRFDLIFDAETTYALSGDENLSQCSKNATLLPKQLTPRQGTKSICANTIAIYIIAKQLTPRQGTKTCDSSHAINTFIETTHTPSGDENNVATGKLYGLSKGNNLHPVRGRKLYCISEFFYAFARNNLHPARGRKPLEVQTLQPSARNNLRPSGNENAVS